MQLRSAVLSRPIWLHLHSSWSRAHADVQLGCLCFYRSAADLRPSQPGVTGRRQLGDRSLVTKTPRKGRKPEGMHDVMPGEGARRPQLPLVYFYSRRLSGQLCAPVPSTCVHSSHGQRMNMWIKNRFPSFYGIFKHLNALRNSNICHKCHFLHA